MPISGRRPAALPIAAVLAIIGFCVLVRPAPVLAQTNLTATASTGVGVTDNDATFSTGSAGTHYGAFWLANAGLHGTWAGQKESQGLSYSFGITRSFVGNGRSMQTHALSWNGDYSPNGVLSITGGVSASLARLDSISIPVANTTSTATVLPAAMPIPSATTYYVTTAAHVGAAWRPTPSLSWTETTSAHVATPIGAQSRTTYGVDEAIAHDRTFGINSFISTARVGYLVAAELKDSLGNVVFPQTETLHGQILAGGQRSLTAFTDVHVSVGGLAAMAPAGGPIVLGPSWRAGLAYHPELGTLSVEVDRTPSPSLYVGRISVSDRLMVSLGLPIDRAGRFHAVGSGGYSRARFLNAQNNLVPGSDVLVGSAGLTFAPLLWPVSIGLHYTRIQQFSYPIDGAQPLPDVERQALMLAVHGTWSRYPTGGGGAAAAAPEGM